MKIILERPFSLLVNSWKYFVEVMFKAPFLKKADLNFKYPQREEPEEKSVTFSKFSNCFLKRFYYNYEYLKQTSSRTIFRLYLLYDCHFLECKTTEN